MQSLYRHFGSHSAQAGSSSNQAGIYSSSNITWRWGEQTWRLLITDGWTFEKIIIKGSDDDHWLWTKAMKAMKAMNARNDKKGKK